LPCTSESTCPSLTITSAPLASRSTHRSPTTTKGQFKRLIGEGPSLICWPLQSVAGRLSLRVKQLDVICETKTKDNVFVQVGVAVQYRVVTESAYDAWYRLTNPTSQIQAYVFDVIRSTVPRLELDSAFESKDDIARAVFEQLQNVMKDYGYGELDFVSLSFWYDSVF
jgi:regulator of protease activity HflC (stomatin/prohibitin superfamily)